MDDPDRKATSRAQLNVFRRPRSISECVRLVPPVDLKPFELVHRLIDLILNPSLRGAIELIPLNVPEWVHEHHP